MASPRFHSVRSSQRPGRQRRSTGHAGRPPRPGARRQRGRRSHRHERGDRRDRARTCAAWAATCSRSCTAMARSSRSNSTGRAGSGADAAALRAEGHVEMPFRHDIRAVTVPGCVDGWIALHERFGTLPLADLLQPAIDLARRRLPRQSRCWSAPRPVPTRAPAENLAALLSQLTRPGARVTPPGCSPCPHRSSPRADVPRSTRGSSAPG